MVNNNTIFHRSFQTLPPLPRYRDTLLHDSANRATNNARLHGNDALLPGVSVHLSQPLAFYQVPRILDTSAGGRGGSPDHTETPLLPPPKPEGLTDQGGTTITPLPRTRSASPSAATGSTTPRGGRGALISGRGARQHMCAVDHIATPTARS